jgi:hypothetical protein
MAYADQAKKMGKTPVQFVELFMQRCTRVYGTSPCTAAIGVTGTDRCYNTQATCQDTANFASADVTYRFSTVRLDGVQQVGDPPTFPTLQTVKTNPTILTPGKGLGVRSSVSVSVIDHPWTDTGCDPYRTLRSYDPDMRGTFWGRFLARYRYYQNRVMRVHTGFLTDAGTYDATNFVVREYIITKISGPGTNGTVTIEGKDPLKWADQEKAQWPPASKATLTSDISSSATAIDITDPDQQVTAWWNAGQRYVRCEDEIMLATAISGSGTTTPSLTVNRSSMPAWYDFSLNVQVAHDAAATVQPCWLFDDEMCYDIIYFLLNTVAGMPASYLPLAEWQAEIDNGFQYLAFSTLLTEPHAVKELLTELTQLSLMIFWHERDGEVKLKGLRFYQLLGDQINDDVAIIAGSVGVSDDPGMLVTQQWMFYDISWPLANPTQLKSYRTLDVRADLAQESADRYGKPAINRVASRWLNRSDAAIASNIGATQLRQNSVVRRILSWSMDPKDDQYWVGDVVGLSTKYVQDETGADKLLNVLITQVEELFSDNGMALKYTGIEQFAFLRTGLIGPDSLPDYSAATTEQKNRYAFVGPNTGLFPDGTQPYQVI